MKRFLIVLAEKVTTRIRYVIGISEDRQQLLCSTGPNGARRFDKQSTDEMINDINQIDTYRRLWDIHIQETT